MDSEQAKTYPQDINLIYQIIDWGTEIPLGWRFINHDEEVQSQNQIIAANNLKSTQMIIVKKQAILIDGRQIEIVAINQTNQDGFVDMQIDDIIKYKNQLVKMLGRWSIVAFQGGKLDGPGYGCTIHNSYGNECGEKFIISTKQ